MTPTGTVGSPRAQLSVLVVDDSLTYRVWLSLVLSERYRVFTAEDGEAGERLARALRPDLILMDVVMPRQDGFATCRALRQEATTSRIPIVLMSSAVERWMTEAGVASGCTDLIVKPTDHELLLKRVARWLGGDHERSGGGA